MRISDWSSDVCSSDLPFGLAAFLGEGLDDLHRAKRLGDERAQIGDPVLTRARKGPDPPAKQHDGPDDERNAPKQHPRTLGGQGEKIADPATAHHHPTQRPARAERTSTRPHPTPSSPPPTPTPPCTHPP